MALLVCLLACFAAGAIGAVASVDAVPFYAELHQPSWAPPPWVFGPVWSLLYLMMAVAAWRVWLSPRPRTGALALFATQLAANALWSWLFFAWRQGTTASIEVVVLLGLVVATAMAFRRIDRAAAWLLVPYAAWVGFATALTITLCRMNPGLLSGPP